MAAKASPFATGGGGGNFEEWVQSAFAVLMLANGYTPGFANPWPIKSIALQANTPDFETDDMVVTTESPDGKRIAKLIAQIKHKVKFTANDAAFNETVSRAWSDFEDPKQFDRDRDRLALITGPMSQKNIDSIRVLLDTAHQESDPVTFHKRVTREVILGKQVNARYKAFRDILDKASGRKLLDAEIHAFLRVYYVLNYDFDIENGVAHAMFHTVIGHRAQRSPADIWGRVVQKVSHLNQRGGTVTKDVFDEEIREHFARGPVKQTMPSDIADTIPPDEPDTPPDEPKFAATCAMTGGWSDACSGDRQVIANLSKGTYSGWVERARGELRGDSPILHHKAPVWECSNQLHLMTQSAETVFDDTLDRFGEMAFQILSERDPQFELDRDQRYMAGFFDKKLTHSKVLREGVCKSLVYFAQFPDHFTNCTKGKSANVSWKVVHDLLHGADWVIWGSLSPLLPILAEACPSEFLDCVEKAVTQGTNSALGKLFDQEGDGFTGRNYMSGLLWALERLAWNPDYLGRVVLILGGLASFDPGGQWANRPDTSIVDILLPWHPQTLADRGRRTAALLGLKADFPDVAWKVLIKLIPNQMQTTSGTDKPKLRDWVPKGWEVSVTKKEFWEASTDIANLAVDMAVEDVESLTELLVHLDDLPGEPFNRVLAHLKGALSDASEKLRRPVWERLLELVHKHRKYADAKWAMEEADLEKLDEVAEAIAPRGLIEKHARLFVDNDFDLLEEEEGEYEEQEEKLMQKRKAAVEEVFEAEGIKGIRKLVATVKSPRLVGHAFGLERKEEFETELLELFLVEPEEAIKSFAGGYVWTRNFQTDGTWIQELDLGNWDEESVLEFVLNLRFCADTWKLVDQHLHTLSAKYWERVRIHPWAPESDRDEAVSRLLQAGRPRAAIDYLDLQLRKDGGPASETIMKALLEAVGSKEQVNQMDPYQARNLIKHLQELDKIDAAKLGKIEWAYLELLRDHKDGRPLTLEKKMAESPSFYMELVEMVYRAEGEEKPEGGVDEERSKMASHAWKLLHQWKITPGTDNYGYVNGDKFREWVAEMKTLAAQSKRLDVALICLGDSLHACPEDRDGFWIDKVVAQELHAKEADCMRRGYRTGVFNSRGVGLVSPNAQAEKELAEKWKRRADEVDGLGFARFAATCRDLASTYEAEAKRIMEDYAGDREWFGEDGDKDDKSPDGGAEHKEEDDDENEPEETP